MSNQIVIRCSAATSAFSLAFQSMINDWIKTFTDTLWTEFFSSINNHYKPLTDWLWNLFFSLSKESFEFHSAYIRNGLRHFFSLNDPEKKRKIGFTTPQSGTSGVYSNFMCLIFLHRHHSHHGRGRHVLHRSALTQQMAAPAPVSKKKTQNNFVEHFCRTRRPALNSRRSKVQNTQCAASTENIRTHLCWALHSEISMIHTPRDDQTGNLSSGPSGLY